MNLKTLLEKSGVAFQCSKDLLAVSITDVIYDSRLVKPGNLFFAIKGVHSDGHQFVKDVAQKGAVAAVVDHAVESPIPFIIVPSVTEAMSPIANIFFDEPSKKIPVIGITGTNGKTTITYLLESMLKLLEKNCGVMGTINYRLGGNETPAPNTTPMSVDVHRFVRRAVNAEADCVVMEVSSHALEQARVNTVQFAIGVFTNLTQDHLDFHKDMETYFRAKSRLFHDFAGIRSVINIDDPYGKRLADQLPQAITYGFDSKAPLRAANAVYDLSGIHFELNFPSGKKFSISSNLMGRHNIFNLLAACGTLLLQGFSERDIVLAASQRFAVPGRLERVDKGQDFVVVVDYAHSEDALVQVLKTLRDTKPRKLYCVFGAGGDRDRTKRPKMGKAATQLADHVIVTSDNPRSENPADIIAEIEAGIKEIHKTNYDVVVDRAEAIQHVISKAEKDDLILIAGKGHETYQIIGTTKHHFSDQETAEAALSKRGSKKP